MRELQVKTEATAVEEGKTSSEDSPVLPVAQFTPREFTLAGSHLLTVHDLGKSTVRFS